MPVGLGAGVAAARSAGPDVAGAAAVVPPGCGGAGDDGEDGTGEPGEVVLAAGGVCLASGPGCGYERESDHSDAYGYADHLVQGVRSGGGSSTLGRGLTLFG